MKKFWGILMGLRLWHNEKITGNWINSVNTCHFSVNEHQSRDLGGGGLINLVPILWEQKLQISDENFSMSQIFGSSKIIIFKNLGRVPKLWVSQFLSTLRY